MSPAAARRRPACMLCDGRPSPASLKCPPYGRLRFTRSEKAIVNKGETRGSWRAGLVRLFSGRPRAARSAQAGQPGEPGSAAEIFGTSWEPRRASAAKLPLPHVFVAAAACRCRLSAALHHVRANTARPCGPSAFLSNTSIHPPHGSLQVLCFACCEHTAAVHEGEAAGR